jgi:RNA polymerase sigma factor for flagellar operon FliA
VTSATRERCIRELFPLVKTIAKRMHRLIPRADTGDLVGDGCIGLIRAVDSYNPRYGRSLKGYARDAIKSAMLNGLRRMDPVPERTRTILRNADRHSPQYDRARFIHYRSLPLSLDAPLPKGEEAPLDTAADPALVVSAKCEREYLRALVDDLPERERRLILAYYYGRLSLGRISKSFEISSQRASQLHLKALARLRKVVDVSTHRS